MPVSYITRDPAAIANHPVYYGAISNLGVLLWGSSATACLLGGIVTNILSEQQERAKFFAAFCGLSVVLCLDDLFMLHEEIFPKSIGISEEAVFLFYAIMFSSMLLRFRKILLKTKPVLFAASLLLFALSVSSDIIPAIGSYTIEDGSKFVAIFVWCAYFLWAAVEHIMLLSINPRLHSANTKNPIFSIAQESSHL